MASLFSTDAVDTRQILKSSTLDIHNLLAEEVSENVNRSAEAHGFSKREAVLLSLALQCMKRRDFSTALSREQQGFVVRTFGFFVTALESNGKVYVKNRFHRSFTKNAETVSVVNTFIPVISENGSQYAPLNTLSCAGQFYGVSPSSCEKLSTLMVENFLSQSDAVPSDRIIKCLCMFMSKLSAETFQEIILPAMERTLLRSPEIIIGYVSKLICSTKFRITPCLAKRLCTTSVTHFFCTADTKRAGFGKDLFDHLKAYCESSESVNIVADYLLSALSGELSDIKLVNSEQRIRCLSMLARFAESSHSSELSIRILNVLKPMIKSEANETIAVEMLVCFTQWLVSLREPLSPEKVAFLKGVYASKASGALLRAAVLNCVLLTEDNAALATSFAEIVNQSFTKTKGQMAHTASVAELFVAANAALRLIVYDSKLEVKVKGVWEHLLDVALLNQLAGDKFYTVSPSWVLTCVLKTIETLFIRFPNRFEHCIEQFSRPLATSLFHVDKNIRAQVCDTMSRILDRSPVAYVLVKCCLDVMPSVLSSHIASKSSEPRAAMPASIICATDNHKQVQKVCEILHKHSESVFSDNDSRLCIALSLLRLACTDGLCTFLPPKVLFSRFLKAFIDDSQGFLISNVASLLKSVFLNFTPTDFECSALLVLLMSSPASSVTHVVSLLVGVFSNSSFTQASKEDVDIMNTAPGVVWDQTALDAIMAAEGRSGNIKRESKNYSYKEQMADMELKKEIAKSRKDLVKLTPAQQAKVDVLLKRESEIRDRLMAALAKFEKEASVAHFLFSNKETGRLLQTYAWQFVPALTLLFKSSLVGTQAGELFVSISKCVFGGASQVALATCVSTAYLRAFESCVKLSKPWSNYSPDEHYSKCAHYLATASNLDAAQFSFAFPLLNHLVHEEDLLSEEDSNKVMTMLHERFTSYDPRSNASFLPRKEFLDLIVFILENSLCEEAFISAILRDLCRTNFIVDDGAYFDEDLAEQLIKMLLHPTPVCRRVALRVFNEFGDFISPVHPALSVEFLGSILIESYDTDDMCHELANKIWTQQCSSMEIMPEFVRPALREVQCARTSDLREACATALVTIVNTCPMLITSVITELITVYRRSLPMAPKFDEFGRPIIPSLAAQQQMLEFQTIRLNIAACFDKLAQVIPAAILKEVFTFLIPTPLADPFEAVRDRMLAAATALLANQGPDVVDTLLPLMEDFLRTAPLDDAALDPARQATVVLTATIARHLAKDDPRVRLVMQKLTETLSTPSEPVQIAVANSMAPLVRSIAKEELPAVIENLLKVLFEGETFAERRGAAYGLASIVKGHGIVALKQFELTSQLQTAIENRKEPKRREGALFAHEIMTRILGAIFEPHIIAFLPHLLTSFGDSQPGVRLAADDCAKEVMSKLTAHGVKLVLPMLLDGLRSDQWRTKCASAELLGAMAYCAPKQLSACLPTIVPRLMETVNDSHAKVQKGGENALRQIQSVVKNPEIQSVSTVLLDALLNPLEKSSACLKTLVSTRLVHKLDAPSLALIMPVIQRALSERHTEPRRCSNQIISSVNAQTDARDFEPYIPSLLPGVKQSLIDPAPDVRLVASKALGALASCMGKSVQDELLPWLLEMLISDLSSANRSGAAQGLCEVVRVLGLSKLEQLIREAVSVSSRSDISSATRDGYLLLFVYLPPVCQEDFASHVQTVIPAILRGLSDESEIVRETALKAGQKLIHLYSEKSQEMFVPELEKGLVNDNWRIRYSSVQLLGEFLFQVGDITGKMTTETMDDDDTFGNVQSHMKIAAVIGEDMTNRLLAGLYLGRQDIALVVRQATVHIWKLIVPNTPRILKQIAPTLLQTILGTFASRNAEKIQISQRTLGDVVRKLGDRMLNDVILYFGKVMADSQSSSNDDEQLEMKREAVCMALTEVITNANKDQLHAFFRSLASPIKLALLDPSPSVRALGAKTFSSLHSVLTAQAITEIVTPLCDPHSLTKEQADYALDALAQIMSLKSRTILPSLLPHLLNPKPNTKALAMISAVAGEAIGRSMHTIIPALIDAVSGARKASPEALVSCLEECQSVMLSVDDEDISRQILMTLLSECNLEKQDRCLSACALLTAFLEETDLDVPDHVLPILKALLALCRSNNVVLLDQMWAAVNVLISKRLKQDDYIQNMNYLRQIVHTTIGNSKPPLPGFVLTKRAVTPILPVYRDCLLCGSPEVKEMAAGGLEEVVRYSSADVLRTQVINITGPLIRVLGDRFGSNVKTAIIGALDALLSCCGPLLKPFIPQLQTTFNKCLIDTQRPIRLRCSQAYGGLAAIHMRPENLLTDLTNFLRSNASEPGVRDSILVAIRQCLSSLTNGRCPDAGANVLCECLFQVFTNVPDVTTRQAAAGCVGALMLVASDAVVEDIIKNRLLNFDAKSSEWIQVHFRIICFQPLLIGNPGKIDKLKLIDEVAKYAKTCVQSPHAIMRASSVRLCLLVLKYYVTEAVGEIDNELASAAVGLLKQGSDELREVVASMLFRFGVAVVEDDKKHPPSPKLIAVFVPQLVMGTKEKQQSLRRVCELALVELLRLRRDTKAMGLVMECLDQGMQETLRELHLRVLKKVAEQGRPTVLFKEDETLIE